MLSEYGYKNYRDFSNDYVRCSKTTDDIIIPKKNNAAIKVCDVIL